MMTEETSWTLLYYEVGSVVPQLGKHVTHYRQQAALW